MIEQQRCWLQAWPKPVPDNYTIIYLDGPKAPNGKVELVLVI